MDELLKAMKAYGEGVTQAATAAAFNDANEAIQQMNNAKIDAAQKRQYQDMLGKQLVARLGAAGAGADTIKQAFAVFQPQQFSSPEAAITEGYLGGNQDLIEMGGQAQEYIQQKQMRQFQAQEAMKLGADERRAQREQDNIRLKASLEKNQPVKLHSDELKTIQGLKQSEANLRSLLSQVEKDPSLAGPLDAYTPNWMDPKRAAFRRQLMDTFNEYKHKITGAAMSDKERPDLEAATLQETDTAPVFLAKAKSMLGIGRRVYDNNLDVLEMGGRDVSKFKAEIAPRKAAAAFDQQAMDLLRANQQFVKGRK